jgi:hypothetical protein
MKNLVCPVSEQRVNEQVTRLNAMFTIGITTLALVINSVVWLVFMMADFYIRAFTDLKYSPISYVSHSISHTLSLPVKLIDKAPKIFAARLGFLMSLTITALYIPGFNVASYTVAGILVFFAGLEFVFAICVGCLVYTYAVLPFYKKQ